MELKGVARNIGEILLLSSTANETVGCIWIDRHEVEVLRIHSVDGEVARPIRHVRGSGRHDVRRGATRGIRIAGVVHRA